MVPRRFPPPWSVEEQDACYCVRDHNGQQLAYVYFEEEITVETLVAESEQVRLAAMNTGQLSAANTAIKGKAVLTGNWVERAEIGQPGEFDNMSDEELQRALDERLAALGYVRGDETAH